MVSTYNRTKQAATAASTREKVSVRVKVAAAEDAGGRRVSAGAGGAAGAGIPVISSECNNL